MKYLSILLAVLVPALVMAETQIGEPIVAQNVATGAAPTVTSSLAYSGFVEGFYVKYSGAHTVNVSIATSSGTLGTALTMLTLTGKTAAGYYPIRTYACDTAGVTTNVPVRYMVDAQRFTITVSSSNATTATTVVPYMEK